MALKVVTPSEPSTVTAIPVFGNCLATDCPMKINVAIKKGEPKVMRNPSCELIMDNPPGNRPIPKTKMMLATNQLKGATKAKYGKASFNLTCQEFVNCSI